MLPEGNGKEKQLQRSRQLLNYEQLRVIGLRNQLIAWKAQLASVKEVFVAKENALKVETRNVNGLNANLRSARNAISRVRHASHDLVERVCTGYTSLMRAEASCHIDQLNTLLYD